ncbi:hypothetical protein [Nitrosophilus kaiyonis]|uniref:hypothetical protein n=1 Tax=Nitrosophilus kaiyonis TaxID=2930200 RepID=UPI0031E92706
MILDISNEKIELETKPFMEPKHKSIYSCKEFLIKRVIDISPDYLAIDSPFSIPSILCDKNFKPPKREIIGEISNPYIYRYTDYFIYKKFGIKPMPPAGDRIGRITARCIEFLREFHYDGDYIKIGDKKIKIFEVFPKQIGNILVGKNYKNKKEKILNILKIDNFKYDFLKNEHFFDALLAAYSVFEILKNNTIKPENDTIKKEGWIYPITKCSIGK